MEEPTYEYDWRHPIEVPNPKNKSGKSIENGSFKWFQYWLLEGCTYKQLAKHFGVSESTIKTIAVLFKWKERRRNKEDHDTRQREKLQQQRYQEFIDKDYKNAKTQMDALYTLSQIALIYLGVLPNVNNLEIPEDMTVKVATRILQGNPKAIRQMQSQILRDLEKPDRINDNQSYNVTADARIKQDVTVNLLDKVKQKRRELNDLNSNGTTSNTSK